MPTAANISIRETLDLLDGPFAELSLGVAQGQYAFWLGSGISRDRVDDLKRVITRFLRTYKRESTLQIRVVGFGELWRRHYNWPSFRMWNVPASIFRTR
jgi:hypothetical protein